MKNLVSCFVALCAVVALTGCETTSTHNQSSHEAPSSAARGEKCQTCNCKGYEPGKIIKGVCSNCGHSAAEHTPPAK